VTRWAAIAAGLAALAGSAAAGEAPGPESPPPPWFVVADIPSPDPAIADTRWLWNREARTLRYCRQDAAKGEFTCAADVVLPEGRWVLQRIQAAPEAGVASSARFYSPDRDETLKCRATDDGGFSCG
jgi:hypothetical protein